MKIKFFGKSNNPYTKNLEHKNLANMNMCGFAFLLDHLNI
jgi:hypothetical protein